MTPDAVKEAPWDSAMNTWQAAPDDPETIWTITWAEEFWHKATTPLHYSVNALECQESHRMLRANLGHDDLIDLRLFKYWRARPYYNTRIDAIHATRAVPPSLRQASLANVHPEDHRDVLAAPFDRGELLRIILRQLSDPRSGPMSWMRESQAFMDGADDLNLGLDPAELPTLSDRELMDYIEAQMERTIGFNGQMWLGFFTYGAWAMQGLGLILRRWLGHTAAEDTSEKLQHLVSGLPLPTLALAGERHELWRLAQAIRSSKPLSDVLEQNGPAEFFRKLRLSDEGRDFYHEYQCFLTRYAAQGSDERDIYFPRRIEDPAIDHSAFRLIVRSANQTPPQAREQALRERREATTAMVSDQLGHAPFGAIRREAFLLLLDYVHRFLRLRDDQRYSYDQLSLSKKRGFLEIGRRLVSRGILRALDDTFFLSQQELFQLLTGRSETDSGGLTVDQRVSRRRADYQHAAQSPDDCPSFLKGNAPYENGLPGQTTEGPSPAVTRSSQVLRGVGTSAGRVTGKARVVARLMDLQRLNDGEILVCANAGPGWGPGFFLAGGLVLGAGRLLAPPSCLAREHGVPAVTVASATRLIPDGSTITVDGVAGTVTIESAGGEG